MLRCDFATMDWFCVLMPGHDGPHMSDLDARLSRPARASHPEEGAAGETPDEAVLARAREIFAEGDFEAVVALLHDQAQLKANRLGTARLDHLPAQRAPLTGDAVPGGGKQMPMPGGYTPRRMEWREAVRTPDDLRAMARLLAEEGRTVEASELEYFASRLATAETDLVKLGNHAIDEASKLRERYHRDMDFIEAQLRHERCLVTELAAERDALSAQLHALREAVKGLRDEADARYAYAIAQSGWCDALDAVAALFPAESAPAEEGT